MRYEVLKIMVSYTFIVGDSGCPVQQKMYGKPWFFKTANPMIHVYM